jgi:NAD(P)-dependent dehydrogenase (short-subunit alcohol dehydrogenase family)
VAAAALFLGSDDAGYVSAVNLCVDAGWETSAPDLAPFRPQILATK